MTSNQYEKLINNQEAIIKRLDEITNHSNEIMLCASIEHLCNEILKHLDSGRLDFFYNALVERLYDKIIIYLEPVISQNKETGTKFLTQEEAAEELGISYGTLRNWVCYNKIDCCKVPNTRRIFFNYDYLMALKSTLKTEKNKIKDNKNKGK